MNNKLDINTVRNFYINGENEKITKLLSDLSFISKIERDKKVNLYNRTITEDTYINSSFRRINKDGRAPLCKFVKTVLSDAVYTYYTLVQSNDELHSALAKELLNHIISARQGINVLMDNYSGDADTISSLNSTLKITNCLINVDK